MLWLLWERREAVINAWSGSPADLGLIFISIVLVWVVSAVVSSLTFRAQGYDVGFWEAFTLTGATNLGNYLPMRTGSLIRAEYMKYRYGMPYTRSGSVYGIRAAAMVIAGGVVGSLGCAASFLQGVPVRFDLVAIFVASVGSTLLVLFVPVPLWQETQTTSRALLKIRSVYRSFVTGLLVMREQPVMSLKIVGLEIVHYLLMAWRFGFGLHLIGVNVGWGVSSMWAAVVGIATYLSFTPGGIGVREAMFVYVGQAVGLKLEQSLAAGAFDRAAILTASATMGTASFIWVWRRVAVDRVANRRQSDRTGDADA